MGNKYKDKSKRKLSTGKTLDTLLVSTQNIRRNIGRRSLTSRLIVFILAFILVKIFKPQIDRFRNPKQEAYVQIGNSNNQLTDKSSEENFLSIDPAAISANGELDSIQKQWNELEEEAKTLESQLSDSPSEQHDTNGNPLRLMDDADLPRGAPSQDNFAFIDDSVDDKDVTFREKILKVTNRTVYIKEVVPRVFYSTNNLNGGVSRLTVVIFHDRSDHKDSIFMGSCCTDLWSRLGTLNRIAKEGHKVIAIDLPGYGKSAAARNVDYVVYQFFTRLEQVLKLDKYVVIVPGFTTRLLVPYYFRRSKLLQGMMIIAPPQVLSRSLQIIGSTGSITQTQTDDSDPKGLDTFDIETQVIYEKNDHDAAGLWEDYLKRLQKGSKIEIDVSQSPPTALSQQIPLEKRTQYFYMVDPKLFHEKLVAFLFKVNL